MTSTVSRLEDYAKKRTVAQPPGGGDNGGMDPLEHLEKRVDDIDMRLGRIEGDVSSIKDGLRDLKVGVAELNAKLNIGQIQSNVEKAHTDIYKWIVSIIAVVGAIYFGIQKSAPPTAPSPALYPYASPSPSPSPLPQIPSPAAGVAAPAAPPVQEK